MFAQAFGSMATYALGIAVCGLTLSTTGWLSDSLPFFCPGHANFL